MKLLFILFLTLFSVGAEDKLTVEQFKKIINGKETETINDELKQFPLFKKFQMNMVLKSPGKEPFKVSTTGTEKYIAGKYLLTIMEVPNNKPFYSFMMWNKEKMRFESWLLSPDEKIGLSIGKIVEGKKRILWEGKTFNGDSHKGYTDFGADLISWESKYYSPDGKYLYSESGNAIPLD